MSDTDNKQIDLELVTRYHTDPLFHALVTLERHGFMDDDCCFVEGPTIADARRVERFLKGIESVGSMIVPRSFVESVLYSGSFEAEDLDKLHAQAEGLLG